MKKFGQSLFAFVAMLVFASVVFAQTLPTYTADQARDILSNPEKFVQTYKALRRSDDMQKSDSMSMRIITPAHIARQLLDLAQSDQSFLRNVYAIYAPLETSYNGPTNESAESTISQAFIVENTIELMQSSDDAFFKRAFEFAAGKNHDYYIRTKALCKINDLTYVKKVITEDARADEGVVNPGADFLLLRGDELYKADPKFVDELAKNAKNTYVRSAAIEATSNRKILRQYANLTDIDQYRHKPNSEAAYRAFQNNIYQHVATQRLARLSEK